MIVLGAFIGPWGLVMENPAVAGFGNAMLFAGALTPNIMVKKLSTKDGVFYGIWTATVVYFCINGGINVLVLSVATPLLLLASLTLTKYSGLKLSRKAVK